MKNIILLLLFIPLVLEAQDDLKVKTGTFDYSAYGRVYEYTGEYVMSKESGSKEKLPHGKGKLTQPEKLEKAVMAGWVSGVEKFTKKGYAAEPYLYDGEWHMGKKQGTGKEFIFTFQETQSKAVVRQQSDYNGKFKNDVFHGKGKLATLEFDYEGNFVEGKKEGFGKITYKNKDTYTGEFKADQYHGQGTINYFEKKESFKGEFENNVFRKGLYTYSSGDTYEGEWKGSVRNGKGKYTWANGNVYEGDFINNERTGIGKYTWKSTGDIFEGDWKAGMRAGHGKSTSKNGDVYEGDWFDDKRNGHGKLTLVSGAIYEGNWKDNKKNGAGKQSFTDGRIYEGEWKDNEHSGFGKLTWRNGDFYEGEWKDSKFHGQGTFIKNVSSPVAHKITLKGSFQNGDIVQGIKEIHQGDEKRIYHYIGAFSSGKEHGKGKIEYFENSHEALKDWSENKVKSYEGDWANGKPNGLGTMVYKNGSKITGNFRNGEYEVFSPPSIQIGNQVWMTENLNVDKFRNGDPIPHAKTSAEWEKARKNKQPAWCYYDYDPANGKKYGKLYNWYAVNDPRGLAPKGWHVPSDAEWGVLADYLGENAGGKMKSESGWVQDGNGTNESGFTALPAGILWHTWSDHIGWQGYWWSSTEYNTSKSWCRNISFEYGCYLGKCTCGLHRYDHYKGEGLSVRCLRD